MLEVEPHEAAVVVRDKLELALHLLETDKPGYALARKLIDRAAQLMAGLAPRSGDRTSDSPNSTVA